MELNNYIRFKNIHIEIYKNMFRKAIINKDKRNTYGIKGFVTNSGAAFPLAPSDLLLEVVDLKDLKREAGIT